MTALILPEGEIGVPLIFHKALTVLVDMVHPFRLLRVHISQEGEQIIPQCFLFFLGQGAIKLA